MRCWLPLVAGKGSWVGFGFGGWWCGQSHEELIGLLGEVLFSLGTSSGPIMVVEWRASRRVGKFGEIMPSAVHVSQLKNSLSALLVMYTISWDSRGCPDLEQPENRKLTAPRILMPWLFVACICMVPGIRSPSHKLRWWITVMLARQL